MFEHCGGRSALGVGRATAAIASELALGTPKAAIACCALGSESGRAVASASIEIRRHISRVRRAAAGLGSVQVKAKLHRPDCRRHRIGIRCALFRSISCHLVSARLRAFSSRTVRVIQRVCGRVLSPLLPLHWPPALARKSRSANRCAVSVSFKTRSIIRFQTE